MSQIATGPGTGYEDASMTRARLQRALFAAIDEKTRMCITAAHPQAWRYDAAIAEAREQLRAHDAAHGAGGEHDR